MTFYSDINSSTWRFSNIQSAMRSQDDSMSGSSSEKEDESDDDDDDNDDEIIATEDDDEIRAVEKDDEMRATDDDEMRATDDDEIGATDDDEIGATDDDNEEEIWVDDEIKDISNNETKIGEETSDNDIICDTSSDDETIFGAFGALNIEEATSDEPLIVEDEDVFNEMLDEFMLEIGFECHRAAKLGIIEGKLSILFWKSHLYYRPPEKEIQTDGGDKKRKKKKGSGSKIIICRNQECGEKIALAKYAKHFTDCIKGTLRTTRINYNVDKMFSEMAQDCTAPRSRGKKTKKPAAKSTAKAAASASQNIEAFWPYETTRVKQKRKPRTPAYTYQSLLAMSLEDKRTFFSKHCGVKLKFSKKDSLCPKAVCTMHTDKERLSMRDVHLSTHKSGTYAHC